MTRYNPNENQNKAEWFRLADNGDTAEVQFFGYHTLSDLNCYTMHKTTNKKGYTSFIECLKHDNEPIDVCPFCKANKWRTTVYYLVFYDYRDGKVKIWQRTGSFYGIIRNNIFDNPKDISKNIYQIKRIGERGSLETTYEIKNTGKTNENLQAQFPNVDEIVWKTTAEKMAKQLEYENTKTIENKQNKVVSQQPNYNNYNNQGGGWANNIPF